MTFLPLTNGEPGFVCYALVRWNTIQPRISGRNEKREMRNRGGRIESGRMGGGGHTVVYCTIQYGSSCNCICTLVLCRDGCVDMLESKF